MTSAAQALAGSNSTVRCFSTAGEKIARAGHPAPRAALLCDYGIGIGSSLGPLHGEIWRIGAMGYNAREDRVLTTLAALDSVLATQDHRFSRSAGVDAAQATDTLALAWTQRRAAPVSVFPN